MILLDKSYELISKIYYRDPFRRNRLKPQLYRHQGNKVQTTYYDYHNKPKPKKAEEYLGKIVVRQKPGRPLKAPKEGRTAWASQYLHKYQKSLAGHEKKAAELRKKIQQLKIETGNQSP